VTTLILSPQFAEVLNEDAALSLSDREPLGTILFFFFFSFFQSWGPRDHSFSGPQPSVLTRKVRPPVLRSLSGPIQFRCRFDRQGH